MNDHGTTHHRVAAEERDELVVVVYRGLAVLSSLPRCRDLRHGALYPEAAVCLSVGIEVGTGRDTAVGVVAPLVDVEAMPPWSESVDLPGDFGGLPLRRLLEMNHAAHPRVSRITQTALTIAMSQSIPGYFRT